MRAYLQSRVCAVVAAMVVAVAACSGATDAASDGSAVESTGGSSPSATEIAVAPTVQARPTPAPTATPVSDDAVDPTVDASPAPVATSVEPTVRLPDNPGTVVATNWLARNAMDANSVELAWAVVEDADVYRLYRQPTADADYDAITAGDLGQTELIYEGSATDWVDPSPPTGEFLTYVLVAQVGQDLTEPRWTEALTVVDTEPPSAITGLTAENTNDGVLLQWNPSTDNVEFGSYSVSLIDDDQQTYIGGGADESLTTFLDTDTTPGTRTYQVVATDFHNNQSLPATIQITRN